MAACLPVLVQHLGVWRPTCRRPSLADETVASRARTGDALWSRSRTSPRSAPRRERRRASHLLARSRARLRAEQQKTESSTKGPTAPRFSRRDISLQQDLAQSGDRRLALHFVPSRPAPKLVEQFGGRQAAEDLPGRRGRLARCRPSRERSTAQRSAGKVVMLDFWATWCRPLVVGQMPLARSFGSEDEGQGSGDLRGQPRRVLRKAPPRPRITRPPPTPSSRRTTTAALHHDWLRPDSSEVARLVQGLGPSRPWSSRLGPSGKIARTMSGVRNERRSPARRPEEGRPHRAPRFAATSSGNLEPNGSLLLSPGESNRGYKSPRRAR
jgi:hypothetical protein